MTPKKIRSFKWNIYWILESNIKHYEGISKDKWRPVVVISSDIIKFHNQWLVIECSSHSLDEHSILMDEYVNNDGEKRESWILPNRVHTLNSHLFRFDKKWYKQVPKQIRLQVIKKFYTILTPEITKFFLSANSDIISDVTNINIMKDKQDMKINTQGSVIDCNFKLINNVNARLLEGNKNTVNGSVDTVKGNLNILNGKIKHAEGNYNTIFSDCIETVNGNFNKIYGKPKEIIGNFNKYIDCNKIDGIKNNKI